MPVNKASKYQKKIAKLLCINISDDSRRVAGARIHDVVDAAIDPGAKTRLPTESQLKFAEEIGIAIATDSYRVSFAKIADKLDELNEEAMSRMQLRPGDKVIFAEHLSREKELQGLVYTISSIGRNGKVYFRDTPNNGQAWPAQLTKVESTDQM